MKFHQCRMLEIADWNPRQTVGWIPERGAKVGAVVELIEFGSNFRVTHVSKMGIEASELKAKQDRDRDFGASIR